MITRGNMNRIISNSLSILTGILITAGVLVTCERFEPESELVFRTESVEELDEGGFRVTGRIFHIGDHAILQHGFCWAESDNPTLNDRATRLGRKDSEGTFSSMIEDLSLERHYFVRAYVTTGEGTEYGKVIDFMTPPPEVPTVITASVGVIDETSARGGGEITSDGGAPVTERGICWSRSPEPSISDHTTSEGSGTGVFISYMEGLNCSSTYYVRAYATNMAGTGYGDQVSFSTPGCELVPGEFVFSDDDGTWLMNHEGERFLFAGTGGRNVEVYEDRVYIKSGREISVFNRDRSLYGRIDIDSRIEMALIMCVLPDGNLAFLDNEHDLVSFTNPHGELIHEISLSGVPADDNLQSVHGVVVDNGLIISEDGNKRIIRIDLDTYEWSVFRDFQHLTGWLGDIDHAEGTYYLCQSMKLYSFREGEEERLICQLPEGNNSGIAVLGDFAYVVSNHGNKVYRVNVNSGDYDVIVSDANYPQDIELLP